MVIITRWSTYFRDGCRVGLHYRTHFDRQGTTEEVWVEFTKARQIARLAGCKVRENRNSKRAGSLQKNFAFNTLFDLLKGKKVSVLVHSGGVHQEYIYILKGHEQTSEQ